MRIYNITCDKCGAHLNERAGEVNTVAVQYKNLRGEVMQIEADFCWQHFTEFKKFIKGDEKCDSPHSKKPSLYGSKAPLTTI